MQVDAESTIPIVLLVPVWSETGKAGNRELGGNLFQSWLLSKIAVKIA